MSIEITRRDFLKTAATAAVAVAGPGQLIRPGALLAAGLPARRADGGISVSSADVVGHPARRYGRGDF